MGLGAGEAPQSPLEANTVPAKKSSSAASRSALMILLVLAVAAAALYVMRMTGNVNTTDTEAASAEQQIDQALKSLLKINERGHGPAPRQRDLDADAVIARFADDPIEKQVGVDELVKNPFEVMLRTEDGTQSAEDKTVAAAKQRAENARLDLLRKELAGYRLQTIMTGASPMAMVSDQVVQVGDQLGSFRVAAIEEMAVTLTVDDNTYHLTMDSSMAMGKTR
jgi:hypothetical protein